MAGGSAPQPSSAAERKRLIEEYEKTKRLEAERYNAEKARALRRERRTRPLLLGLLLAVLLYLSFNPPAWLTPEVPVPSAAKQEAGIRFAIYLQAQQLEHFRTTRGRLPSSLEEAGPPLPGIRYTVTGTTYRLQSTRDTAIRYQSPDPLNEFLGESMTLLGPGQ